MNDLTVSGLTQLELRDLEAAVGAANVTVEQDKRSAAAHPEPTTLIVAVLALTPAALTAITTILLRAQKRKGRRIRVERKTAEEEFIFELDETDETSGAPSADVISALAKGLAIDLTKLQTLMGQK